MDRIHLMVERLILNDLVEKETVFKRLIIDYLITITCICYENMFIASLSNASILLQFKPLAIRVTILDGHCNTYDTGSK